MSINKKWSLVSFEPLDPNSKKVEELYKAKNFSIDIAFGTSLFVFYDLNTYFQLLFAVIFSRGESFLNI